MLAQFKQNSLNNLAQLKICNKTRYLREEEKFFILDYIEDETNYAMNILILSLNGEIGWVRIWPKQLIEI